MAKKRGLTPEQVRERASRSEKFRQLPEAELERLRLDLIADAEAIIYEKARRDYQRNWGDDDGGPEAA